MSINTPQTPVTNLRKMIYLLEINLTLPTARAIVGILELAQNNPTGLLTVAGMLILE